MLIDHYLCTAVQITRPSVIPQASPVGHDFFLRSLSQALDARKPNQEAFVIGDNGADLGLLQHDVRLPDPIGVCCALPGQVMSTMLALPVADLLCEVVQAGR